MERIQEKNPGRKVVECILGETGFVGDFCKSSSSYILCFTKELCNSSYKLQKALSLISAFFALSLENLKILFQDSANLRRNWNAGLRFMIKRDLNRSCDRKNFLRIGF